VEGSENCQDLAVLGVVIGLQCAEFPGCHWPYSYGDGSGVAMEYMDHGGTTPKPTPRKVVPGSSILR